jgi:hypothetical protein
MSFVRRPANSTRTGPSWAIRAAVFMAVAAGSGGVTFGVLSQLAPARAIPSAVPIGIVQALPPEPAPVPAPPRRVRVDSVAVGFRPDARALRDLAVGWVDGAGAEDGGAVLVASGWAGDPELGLRVPYVGLGACGTIVATVAVGRERPDVRDAVHPNLDRAGWTARIFAGHLPDCEDRRIEAYAILPGGRVLAKLAAAPAEVPRLAAAGVEADGPAGVLQPGDLPGPELIRGHVARAHQVLRRCAGVECAETARLPRGDHLLAALDRRDGWALVSVPGAAHAGWLPERDLDAPPQRLAHR